MIYTEQISSLRNLYELLNLGDTVPFPITNNIFTTLIKKGFNVQNIKHQTDLFADLTIDNISREKLNHYNIIADCLYDIFELPSPKFSTIFFDMPHRPFIFDKYGNYNLEDANNPFRYPAHHKFSANTLLKYIDLILENDPNAVIILQADHGLHGLPVDLTMDEITRIFNCTEEEAVALWNQVMCAIRLPNELTTEETIKILSDPRNISRFLINNFVGENYDYIPYEFKQTVTGPERN
jgi:hypothetical protein